MSALPQGTILQGASLQYKIIKKLGQGTFGITYLASVKIAGTLGSLDSDVKVAIKEFFMRDVNGRGHDGVTVTSGSTDGFFVKYKEKFFQEAKNLGKLKHPHIINVLEDFEANGTVYYSMEYIDGDNLNNYIEEKGRLTTNETIRIAKQIGEALTFMHGQQMLHLDLKPGNVMMRGKKAVLIDFGLSKQYNENGKPETSTTIKGGTEGYAPIEQILFQKNNAKDFPATMDVYALGGTVYKMLTGKTPPEASIILNDGFPAHELKACGVSDELANCIAKAMWPTKKERFQTIDAFIQEMEKWEISNDDEDEDEDDEKTITQDQSHHLGGDGKPKDYQEALKWLREAAENGDADAMAYLGSMYQNGLGVKQDNAKAIKWFKKAAKKGNVQSQFLLASFYEKGDITNKDEKQARKWYEKAALQGHKEANKKHKELTELDNISGLWVIGLLLHFGYPLLWWFWKLLNPSYHYPSLKFLIGFWIFGAGLSLSASNIKNKFVQSCIPLVLLALETYAIYIIEYN